MNSIEMKQFWFEFMHRKRFSPSQDKVFLSPKRENPYRQALSSHQFRSAVKLDKLPNATACCAALARIVTVLVQILPLFSVRRWEEEKKFTQTLYSFVEIRNNPTSTLCWDAATQSLSRDDDDEWNESGAVARSGQEKFCSCLITLLAWSNWG